MSRKMLHIQSGKEYRPFCFVFLIDDFTMRLKSFSLFSILIFFVSIWEFYHISDLKSMLMWQRHRAPEHLQAARQSQYPFDQRAKWPGTQNPQLPHLHLSIGCISLDVILSFSASCDTLTGVQYRGHMTTPTRCHFCLCVTTVVHRRCNTGHDSIDFHTFL